MTSQAVRQENLFASVARRKFRSLLCALRSAGFFHHLWLAAVRVERLTAEVSGETAEIGTTKKYCQSVDGDQPDGERFGSHARLPFFALNGSMHFLHFFELAVIHPLPDALVGRRSLFVHCPPFDGEAAGDGAAAAGAPGAAEAGDAAGDGDAAATDVIPLSGCD